MLLSVCTFFVWILSFHCDTYGEEFSGPRKIAVIGSGNWGTAIARRLALNLLAQSTSSTPEVERVHMWVHEEVINGRNLTEVINSDHVNEKYLPGIKLPRNLEACNSLAETCRGATMLFFVVPHQFLSRILSQLKELGVVDSSAVGISLIKGVKFVDEMNSGEVPLQLLSANIQSQLNLSSVAVLMGANVAADVAQDKFVEATVACTDESVARRIAALLECPNTFHLQCSDDVATVELCGAVKNVVALGAGFCDGMGCGPSTKAALIRQGLHEIFKFCQIFDSIGNAKIETLLQSCGVADLVASSYGGRNRLCAAAFARILTRWRSRRHRRSVVTPPHSVEDDAEVGGPEEECIERGFFSENRGHSSQGDNDADVDDITEARLTQLWETIEQSMLRGQKLQGVETCREVLHCLAKVGKVDKSDLESRERAGGGGLSSNSDFPLLCGIYRIAFLGDDPMSLFSWR